VCVVDAPGTGKRRSARSAAVWTIWLRLVLFRCRVLGITKPGLDLVRTERERKSSVQEMLHSGHSAAGISGTA
jgi:hypothetical protein